MQATSCIGRNSARNLALAMLAAGLAVSVAALPVSAAEKSDGPAKAAKGSRGLGTQVAHLVPQNHDFETYLDRLMMAESSGRDFLKNSRSSALGPFQFIKGTFLYVTRRHFQSELAGKSQAEILALRTNRAFSRKVIAVYPKELAQHLDRHDLPTTYGNLRLAYLLGPSGATKVLKAEPSVPIRRLISKAAVAANPFLAAMTAQDLIDRARRDISMDRSKQLRVERSNSRNGASGPRINVRCNLSRPSCRRWLALKKRRLKSKQRRASAD